MREGYDKSGAQFGCTHEDGRECEHHRNPDGTLTFWTPGRYTVEGCPERFVTPRVREIVAMWVRTKRHGLPFSGGWAEQPAVIMDLIDLLDAEDIVLRELERERHADK